jgi:hypothetical protein
VNFKHSQPLDGRNLHNFIAVTIAAQIHPHPFLLPALTLIEQSGANIMYPPPALPRSLLTVSGSLTFPPGSTPKLTYNFDRVVCLTNCLPLDLNTQIHNVTANSEDSFSRWRGCAQFVVAVDSKRYHGRSSEAITGSNLKPCELFDLICGTSTGELIAIMLGPLGMVQRKYCPVHADARLWMNALRRTSTYRRKSSMSTMSSWERFPLAMIDVVFISISSKGKSKK